MTLVLKTPAETACPLDLFAADQAVIAARFHDITHTQPDRLTHAQNQLCQQLAENGLHFEGRPYPVSIRPLLFKRHDLQSFHVIAETFSHLLDKVAEYYVADSTLRPYFSAYHKVSHYAERLPSHRPIVRIFRLDGLFDANGHYQVIETNTDCPGGVIQNGLAARIWSGIENPLLEGIRHDVTLQPFAADTDLFLKELLCAHKARTGQEANRAAIVTYKGRFKNEVDWMVNGLNRLGVETETLDATQLTRVDGKVLDPQGRPIALAYNKLDLRDLIDEAEVADYLAAAKASEITFLNPLIGQWMLADKAILAVLSDPHTAVFLSDDERAFCARHIPWTRLLQDDTTTLPDGTTVNLLHYLLSHRTDVVLKPSNATRGEGVTVGRFCNDTAWQQAVAEALASPCTYVVQAYLPGRRISAVHPDSGIVNALWSGLDTYVYGGKFAGFQARASFDPVMNVGRRGILLPVTVME